MKIHFITEHLPLKQNPERDVTGLCSVSSPADPVRALGFNWAFPDTHTHTACPVLLRVIIMVEGEALLPSRRFSSRVLLCLSPPNSLFRAGMLQLPFLYKPTKREC